MKSKWLLQLCLLAASIALAVDAFAQAPRPAQAKASGNVTTAAKVAVPGATVRLVNVETGQGWVSWSDENGKFELPGLPPGRFRVVVEQLGFEPTAREVELKADAPAEIDFTLKIASLAAFAQAIVTEKKEAAPTPAPAAPVEAKKEEIQAPAATTAPLQATAAQQAQGRLGQRTTPGAPGQQPGAVPPGGAPRQGQPGQAQAMTDAIRQRMAQGGFQQVDPNAAAGAAPEVAGAMNNNIDTGPLGEASSSDAFLLSGTIGRGATAGGDFSGGFGALIGMMGGMGGFGGFGPGGVPGGGQFPGGGGAFPGAGGMPEGGAMIFMQGMGPGGQPQQGRGGQQQRQQPGQARGGQGAQGRQAGQQQQGQQGAAGQRAQGGPGGPGTVQIQGGNFGQGLEALWGMQRLLRLAANRLRVGFTNRYGNSVWDARPYALTGEGKPKINTYRESFGVNLGGPLYIPKVYNGREKTFFFANFDLSKNQNPVDTFSTVPLPEERAGDFTARGLQLFDPASNLTGPRTAFGSVIPTNRIDSAAAGLLAYIPLPNLPGMVQNFHLRTRVPVTTNRLNVRVLHTLNPRLNLQVSYGANWSRSQSIPSFPTLRGKQSSLGQNASIGLTQQWMPRLTHDTRVNWSRNSTDSRNLFSNTQDIASNLGITGISTDPINYGVPAINYTNFTDLNDPVPAIRHNQTFRFTDSFSFTHKKHTFRTGFEIRRQQLNSRNDPVARGQFTFTGLMSSQLDVNGVPVANTGYDFADFLLGLPQSTNVRFGSSNTYFRSWGYNVFAQDDWRIHPRFSLSLGLRYEAATPPVELFDRLANLDMNSSITAVSLVLPNQVAPFSGALPRALLRGDYNNWGPRIGLAWRPKPMKHWKKNMTVRAGYSMMYNGSIYGQLSGAMANQPPHAQAQTLLTSSATVLTLQNGFPAVAPGDVSNTIAIDPNYRVGYAQMWNLAVETELVRNITLDVTYTGTKGTHLDMLRSPNRAVPTDPLSTELTRRIPNAPGFTYDTFGASSIYHAMQVSVRRRMARGFMLMGTYTYGKSIDNASSIGGGAQVVVQDDSNFNAERGLSSFDIRHQFRAFYNWELPFGERKKWANKGKAASILSNISMNGNLTLMSGTPYTARLLGNAANNSGTGNSFSERPDQVGDPSLPRDQRTTQHWFNTSAFAAPPAGRFGNAARNTIAGPGQVTFNLSVGKFIRLGKDGQRRLDFRWEADNLFNTPNFAGLGTVFGSSNYGRVTGTRQMRTMNVNIRVNF